MAGSLLGGSVSQPAPRVGRQFRGPEFEKRSRAGQRGGERGFGKRSGGGQGGWSSGAAVGERRATSIVPRQMLGARGALPQRGHRIPAAPASSPAPAHSRPFPSSTQPALPAHRTSAWEMRNHCKRMRPELPGFIPGYERKQFSLWDFYFLSFTQQTQLCLLKTSVGCG